MSADLAFRLTGFGGIGTKPASGTAPTDAAGSSSFGGLLDTMARAKSATAAPGAAAGSAAVQVARQSAMVEPQPQLQAPDAAAMVPTPMTMSRRSAAMPDGEAGGSENSEPADADPAASDASPTTIGAGIVDVAALAQAVWLATPAASPPPSSLMTGDATEGQPPIAANQTGSGSSATVPLAGTPVDPAPVSAPIATPANPASLSTPTAAPDPSLIPAAPVSAVGAFAAEAPATLTDPVSQPTPGLAASVATPSPIAAPAAQAAPAPTSGAIGLVAQAASGTVAAAAEPQVVEQTIAPLPAVPATSKAATARPVGAKPAAPVQQSAGSSPLPAPLPAGTAGAGSGHGTTHGGSQDQGSSDQSTPPPDLAAQDPGAASPVVPSIAATDLSVASQAASASQQVVAALSSLAGTAVDSSVMSDAAAPVATAAMGPPGTVRTLPDGGREVVVKLDPEHLGSVSIRLKMTGSKVEVSITVSDAHTLDILNRDRHVLSAAVSSAGLAGTDLMLEHGASDTGRTASGSSMSNDQQSQMPDGRGGASASEDPSGNHRRRDPRPTSSAMLDDVGEAGSPGAIAKRSGALYV